MTTESLPVGSTIPKPVATAVPLALVHEELGRQRHVAEFGGHRVRVPETLCAVKGGGKRDTELDGEELLAKGLFHAKRKLVHVPGPATHIPQGVFKKVVVEEDTVGREGIGVLGVFEALTRRLPSRPWYHRDW